jgi:hypothetical protein
VGRKELATASIRVAIPVDVSCFIIITLLFFYPFLCERSALPKTVAVNLALQKVGLVSARREHCKNG